MAFCDEIVTLLRADLPLVAILTGGIFSYPSSGRKGLTRLLQPTAYDEVNGLLKPCAIVLEWDADDDGQIVGQSMSQVTPIYVIVYDKGDSETGYTNIIAACDRLFTLLHLTQITDACQLLHQKTVKYKREAALKDSGYFRMIFNVYGYQSVT